VPNARGTELALYPNLNAADPVWRAAQPDVRFRKALSLGIDRKTLNNVACCSASAPRATTR
jgi:peptide/nickel transport system substrate-binding protein